MNENKELTIQKQETKQVSFPTQSDWQQIIDIATRAFRSGLLPEAIRSAESASIIALKAWELGLPPMMAFSHINIVNGKPSLSAELMQTLVRKNLPGIQITILQSSEKEAVIKILRPERGSVPSTFSFSWDDAMKAGLTNKLVWKQYPKAMLFSRCMSAALRQICPDALMGVSYTPEELESTIEVSHKPVPEFSNVVYPSVSYTSPVVEKKVENKAEQIIEEQPAQEPEVSPIATAEAVKFEHLNEEDIKLLSELRNDAKKSKSEIMAYCHRNFSKPLLAITQEEFKILCNDLKDQAVKNEG